MNINIDDLTLGQIKQIQLMTGKSQDCESAFLVGEKYFIRTATYHVTGQIIKITPSELVLSDAAWIADSGRFSNALKTCSFLEVEPYHNPVIVSRLAIIDATVIDKLPVDLK
jgi:hypothetical protein